MSTCTHCGESAVIPGSQYCATCSPSIAAAAGIAPIASASPIATATTARPRPTIGEDTSAEPRRSWFLTAFWGVLAVLFFIVGVSSGPWWLVVFALASAAYAVYLFRGGRYRMWFF